MSYHKLNPLEKEYLIKQYRACPEVQMADFCAQHQVSVSAFQEWLKRYDANGISGLYRTKRQPSILPEGIDETEEALRREVIRLRIENERLKKGYTRILREDGTPGAFVPLSETSTPSSRRSPKSFL